MTERYLVTGALGCIGAWTVKRLVSEGAAVWTYDLPGSQHRLELILDEAELASVQRVAGDITDAEKFTQTVVDNGITHIIHLAALQVPFVRADPILGMRVNVVGTTIVFETVKRYADQIQGLAFASSAGVYGPAELYPPGPLAHDAPLAPTNLYGVSKQANEGIARIYWQEYGIRSIGLRPYIIYGPGRDQGMTSTPTKAMLAAAIGRPYHISFGGVAVYHHASDAAAVFVKAARTQLDNAPVYNLGGNTAHMTEMVAAIEAAVPAMAGKITFEPTQLATAPEVDDSALNAALGPITWRPLTEGVQATIDHLRQGVQTNKVNIERILA
ncbi:MAG: NAD(P)-dependent oxidoreductase [Caldilineaceae bacterium]|nr:NAD(P)-dependent oxidoreductase [Caldilineaceae bacterium]